MLQFESLRLAARAAQHEVRRSVPTAHRRQPTLRIGHAVHHSDNYHAVGLRLVDCDIAAFDKDARGGAQFGTRRAHVREIGGKSHLMHDAVVNAVRCADIVVGNRRPDRVKVGFGAGSKGKLTHAGQLWP